MIKLLLQHETIVNSVNTDLSIALHSAASHGNNIEMEMFIKLGVSVYSRDSFSYGWTPLHFAAHGNHIQCAKTLIKHRAPIDAVDSNHQTPLLHAVKCGYTDMMRLLLEENADPNARDSKRCTPLHACRNNEISKLLLQYKATIEVTDNGGWSPLQYACMNGAFNCVTYLLEHGANPNMTANDGSTALYIATRDNQADVVKILIQYGANFNARCTDLQSALHIASAKGNVDIATLLLQAGANPNSADKYNSTPLKIAHNEVAAILVKYGAQTCNNS